jgi:ribonuclease Z
MARLHTLGVCPSLEVKVHGVNWTIQGRSKAAERTGFVIVEHRIFLDAGMSSETFPTSLLLTHGHPDHAGELSLLAVKTPRRSPFTVYVPKGLELSVEACCLAIWNISRCRQDEKHALAVQVQPVEDGQTLPLMGVTNLFTRVVSLKHSVKTVGYILIEKRKRLKDEYQGLNKDEIVKLGQKGVDVSVSFHLPRLAYLCDLGTSSLEYLFLSEKCGVSADTPIVMIECTYLDQLDRKKGEAKRLSQKKHHLHWEALHPIVLQRPNTLFILFHFSLIYHAEAEIQEKFSFDGSNVVLWLDSGVWHPLRKTFITKWV